MKINLIIFRIAGKHFAFQLEKIPLIIKLDKVKTSIPDPNEIPETINYLFEEIKIINLHKTLNLDQTPLGNTSKLILGDFGHITAGCFVDKVVSLMKIDETDIIQPEDSQMDKNTLGVLRNDPSVKYLDVEKVFHEQLQFSSIKS